MVDNLKKILKDINQINNQRRYWMLFSSIVFVGVAGYISFWNWIHNLANPFVEWAFISIGLIITINWWYWTMRIVRKQLDHQIEVISVLVNIADEIKIVKTDVKDLNKTVDNNK